MKISCRLCHSTKAEYLFDSHNTHGRHFLSAKPTYQVYRCQNCDAVFLANIKTNFAYYRDSYPNNYYVDSQQPSWLELVWSELSKYIFAFKLRLISPSLHPKTKIKILDLGCGNGDFLAQLSDKHFKKFGLEINVDGQARCLKKGIKVYPKSVEKINFGRSRFDVITLWHVFEHLEDPSSTIQKISQILAKDGRLIIQVPNSRSLGFNLGKANWFHLDSPRHLLLPSSNSMRYILEQHGLKLQSVKNEFYDYPLDLFWSLRKSPLRFLIWPLYPVFKIFSREHLTYIISRV